MKFNPKNYAYFVMMLIMVFAFDYMIGHKIWLMMVETAMMHPEYPLTDIYRVKVMTYTEVCAVVAACFALLDKGILSLPSSMIVWLILVFVIP